MRSGKDAANPELATKGLKCQTTGSRPTSARVSAAVKSRVDGGIRRIIHCTMGYNSMLTCVTEASMSSYVPNWSCLVMKLC